MDLMDVIRFCKFNSCPHENLYKKVVTWKGDNGMNKEVHCKDCGAYITYDSFNNLINVSGWSHNRRVKMKKKDKQQIKSKTKRMLLNAIMHGGD